MPLHDPHANRAGRQPAPHRVIGLTRRSHQVLARHLDVGEEHLGELLDRVLIMNAHHLRNVLAEYESHFNAHRPHRTLKQASRLRALPDPTDADITVIRRDRLGGLLHEYSQAE